MNLFNDIKSKVNNLMKNKTYYTIKGKRYYEEKLLGEGGFGYVYLVEDEFNNRFALKKINIQDGPQIQAIKREISFWQNFNNHPNIIKLISYEINDKMALILMEYCQEGNLFNFINDELIEKNIYIKEKTALDIFKQVVSAVFFIHSNKYENKTIQHRDIKIENILKFDNQYKLCDFGSASTETLYPSRVSKNQVKEQFSIYERTTTFIYRPPEMVDEYSGFNVNEKVDVWMLGCVLFTLLYKKHPFMDAQKATIINAFYHFPTSGIYSEKIDDFIRLMLTQNPDNRPSCKDLVDIINNWNVMTKIGLPKETLEIKRKQKESTGGVNLSKDFTPISLDQIKAAQESIRKQQAKKDDDDNIKDILNDLNENDTFGIEGNKHQSRVQIPTRNNYNNNPNPSKIENKKNEFNDLFKETIQIPKVTKDDDDDAFGGFIFANSQQTKPNTKNMNEFDEFSNVFSSSNTQTVQNNNNKANMQSTGKKPFEIDEDLFANFNSMNVQNKTNTSQIPKQKENSFSNPQNNNINANSNISNTQNTNNNINQNVFDFFN